MAKSKDAERLCHKWLISLGYKREAIAKAAAGVMYQKQDILGADLIAMNPEDQSLWIIQVTTNEGQTFRKRRLEKVGWTGTTPAIRISIFAHHKIRNPENRRSWIHFWKIWDMRSPGDWGDDYDLIGPFDQKAIEKITIADPNRPRKKGKKNGNRYAKG